MKSNLVVIDTSVVGHLILPLKRDYKSKKLLTKISNNERDSRIKLGVNLYNSLYWLPSIDFDNTEIIWVGDNKTEKYWRVDYLKNTFESDKGGSINETDKDYRRGYKGNRDSCPDQQWMMKRLTSISGCLSIPGFEADDIAAAICTLFPEKRIHLATVDSDWLQLVNERVTWGCLHGYSPQYRDVAGGLKWFRGKISKSPRYVQEEIRCESLREIVDWKVLAGDASDNLGKGSPREVIDLLNPPEEFSLHKVEYRDWISSHFIQPISFEETEDAIDKWINNYKTLPTPMINRDVFG
jgi:hypothetical protein